MREQVRHDSWDVHRPHDIAGSLVGVGQGYILLGHHVLPVEPGQEATAAQDLVDSMAVMLRMLRTAHLKIPRPEAVGQRPIPLNDYQIANLRAALKACNDGPGPLNALNTGDWLHEVLYALPEVKTPPNLTAEQMRANAER